MDRTIGHSLTQTVDNWTPTYLLEQQKLDPDIGPALLWVAEGNVRPAWDEVKSESPALRALYQQYESLVFERRRFISDFS